MSTTVDSRVVEMTFNNKQFEKGISQSMDSIDSLNKKLVSLDGDEHMSGLGDSVEKVQVKFSALQAVAFGFLEQLGKQAFTAGTNLVKSLSIDQVTAGFDKYADKTTAMQTIVNATIGKEESMEEATDRVSAALDRLNWFTDETSYNFTDMVGNIGKFTAAGVDLDKSISAMEGIATWAGISGANAQQASSAMYNFSQAMGSGAMMAMDWKSIENANMATKEFKETAIETAAAEGLLAKSFDEAGNAIYKTEKGTIVTAENFRSTLSEKWFDGKVMTETLNAYGGFADKLSETMDLFDDPNLTTSSVIKWIDEYNNAINDSEKQQQMLAKAYKEWGFAGTIEEFSASIQTLASDEYDLGRRAFKAAQEAKTFAEAISATKDAVSTGWMNIFEKIFGNYYEAKELWTELANRLYDAFIPTVKGINDILEDWRGLEDSSASLYYAVDRIKQANSSISDDQVKKWMEDYAAAIGDTAKQDLILAEAMNATQLEAEELRNIFEHVATSEEKLGMGGRTDLIQSFWNLWDAFSNIKAVATEAWESIFGPAKTADESAKTLTKIIKRLQELTAQFRDMFLTEDGLTEKGESLKSVFRGLFAILKIGKKVLDLILAPVRALAKVIGDKTKGLGGSILSTAGNVGEAIAAFSDWLDEVNLVETVTEALYEAFTWIADKIGEVVDKIKELVEESGAIEWITSKWEELKQSFADKSPFEGGAFSMTDALESLKNALIRVGEALKPVWEFIQKIASAIGDKLAPVLEDIKKAYNENGGLKGVLDLFLKGALFANILELITFISTIKKSVRKAANGFGDLFDSLGKAIDNFGKNQRAEAMKKMAEAVLIMVVAVAAMALVIHFLGDDVNEALLDIVALLLVLTLVMKTATKSVNSVTSAAGMAALAAGIAAFAAALVVLVAAVLILAFLPAEKVQQGLIAIGVIVLLMAVVMKSLSKNMTSTIEGAAAIVSFATAIKTLAKAIRILGKLDQDALIQGVVAIASLMFVLTLVLEALDGSEFDARSIGIILAIAVALDLLVVAVALIGVLPFENALQGVAAIAALVFVLSEFINSLKKVSGGDIAAACASMILLAIAMTALIVPILIFGNMDIVKLAQGLLAISVALAAMVLSLENVDADGIMMKAAGLLILAIAIDALVPAILLLGAVDFATVLKGLGAIGILLVLLVGSMAVLTALGPGILTASLALLALGAGLALVGVGTAAFAAGLATLVALGTPAIVMIGLLGAAVVAFIGLLIVEIVVAFVKILDVIAKNMPLIISSVSTILSGLLTILWNNLPVILGIIGTLCLGVVGILAELIPTIVVIVGELCSGILAVLAELVPTVLGIIGILLEGLMVLVTDQVPLLMALLATIVAELLTFIVGTTDQLIGAIQEILDIIAAWVTDELIPWAVKFIFDAILSFLTALDEALRSDFDNIVEMLLLVILDFCYALCKGVVDFFTSDRFKEIMAKIGGIVKDFFIDAWGKIKETYGNIKEAVTDWVKNVKKWFKEKWETFKQAISDFFHGGIKDGIDAAIGKIKEVVKGLIDKIKNIFKGKDPEVDADMTDSGKNLTEGIAVGLEDQSALGKVKGAVKNLADKIKGWFDKEEDIHSPSKEFAVRGMFIDQGLAEGIKDYSNVAEVATKDLADDTLDSMTGLMGALSKSLDDDIDMNPTITPILDLSEIQNGSKTIGGMFNGASVGLTAEAFGASKALNDARSTEVADAVNLAIKRYSDKIVEAFNARQNDTNVNVTLQGDAAGIFRTVVDQNSRFRASTGRSALI